jgi:hypothetical protein
MAIVGWKGLVPVVTVVMALLIAGCITFPDEDEDIEGAMDVTLIIDFEGFDPDTFPDQRVEWNVDTVGDYDKRQEPRAEGAYYVVNDLVASDALDVLTEAERVTGIAIRHHVESQGAFVDSIDGIVNGLDGHYWSYYINDEYGLVSADAADLDDGDEVRWTYMGNPFG